MDSGVRRNDEAESRSGGSGGPIDPQAEFFYVPVERVFEIADATGAIAYDIPGAAPFSHDGRQCSFDDFIKVLGIGDAALEQPALIVRGASTRRPDPTPQSAGLLAISLGPWAHCAPDDRAMLEQGTTAYDVLYAWDASVHEGTHTWKPQSSTHRPGCPRSRSTGYHSLKPFASGYASQA